MGAVLNRGVAANGVIAYQDHADHELFHYLPARIDAVLGETLRDFNVTYYGINSRPYYVDLGGKYASAVGGILSGQAVPDITEKQRTAILREITRRFSSVRSPRLMPLVLREVKVQPVFARHIIDLGKGGSAVFPETLQFGSQFAYNISAPNSLFAQLAAHQHEADADAVSPEFAINISGKPEFYGDPWKARIRCDLSQVWKYVRAQLGGDVKTSYVNVGTSLDQLVQSLIKNGIVDITYIEGTGGKEFGRQLLESTRTLFEALNTQLTSGEGLFRFEPNPKPETPTAKEPLLGAELLPWSVAVNLAFSANTFKQVIHFDQTVSFTGKIDDLTVSSSMSLAPQCSQATRRHFHDEQLAEDGCITQEKSEGLQNRIRRELAARNVKLQEYFTKLEQGTWTFEHYERMVALLERTSLTEHAEPVLGGAMTLRELSLEETSAHLARQEAALRLGEEPDPTKVQMMGDLADLSYTKEDVDALGRVWDYITEDPRYPARVRELEKQALHIDTQADLWHVTNKHNGVAVFGQWDDTDRTVRVYGIGRHAKSNQTYNLYTFDSKGKEKRYRF